MEGNRGGYLEGRSPVIKGTQIRFHPQKRAIRVEQKGEPKVEVVRKDGVVQGLEIFCHCGERIKIEFEYGTPNPPG